MTLKQALIIAAALAMAGAVVGAYLIGLNHAFRNAAKELQTEGQRDRGIEKQVKVSEPWEARINKKNEPAEIEIKGTGEEAHEIATWAAVIDTNRVTVDIGLRYDEKTNVFDLIRFKARGVRDSIYVEKPIYISVPERPKPVAFTAALGVGFATDTQDRNPTLRTAALDAGVVIIGKYRLTGWADTNLTYGIRIGVDF
jgi:hypothetical protein